MFDQHRALDLIEAAVRTTPFCRCGSHTVVLDRAGEIRLVCATLVPPKSLLRRLATLDFEAAHIDQSIVDLSTWLAAA